jgi:magnesium chelatase subunit D
MAAGSILLTFLDRQSRETVHEPDPGIAETEIDIEDLLGQDARRSGARVVGRRGRYVAAVEVLPGETGFSLATDATLRCAAIRRSGEGAGEFAGLESSDLRKKLFESPSRNLIVFVVDASESMQTGAVARIRAAKGAVLGILRKAYQTRSEVALVAFGGDTARIVLPPTSSLDLARPALEKLATGGATPFADGLRLGWQIVRSERLKNPSVNPVFVVISDGEANVPLVPGKDTMKELQAIAGEIAPDGIPAVFIDAAAERADRMRCIAERMGAAYVPIGALTTRCILSSVLPNLR